MSDFCSSCRYSPKERTGDEACPLNYLYWTFLDDIRQKKRDVGQRMALVLKGLDRISADELAAMHAARTRFLLRLTESQADWTFCHDAG